jgi:putative inorganic carbon (hco3(-)) transporter
MRDYVLLLIVLGLVPFILKRAWIGAVAWTWIGLMNPHLYTWTLARFPFAQVIAVSFFLSWLIARDKQRLPMTPGVVLMIVLLIFIVAKTPFAFFPDIAWDMAQRYAKVVIVALLIPSVIYSPLRIRWFLWTILFSIGVFYGVKGGIFALATGGNAQVQGPEPSFIGGNTHLGVALLMVVPLFVAFIRDNVSKLLNTWLKRGAIAGFWLTMLAIVFTYSRGALLGLGAISSLLYLQTRRKLVLAVILTPLALSATALVPAKWFERAETIKTDREELDTSALARIQAWGVATNIALRHPLGAGFTVDAIPVDQWMDYANFHHPGLFKAQAAHSIYFQMLGDHGFIGLSLFAAMLIATFVTLWRVRRFTIEDPERAWLAHYAVALMIGLVGYLVAGAFVSLAGFDLLYTYVVLAAILYREAMPSRVVAPRPVPEQHAAAPATGAAAPAKGGQPAEAGATARVAERPLLRSGEPR